MTMLQDASITTVIMHARWARLYHGTKYHDEHGVRPLVIRSAGAAQNKDVLALRLRATVDRLQRMGKTVFIVAEVPEVGIAVPSFIARANYLGRDVAIDLPVADYNQRNADDTAMLQAIAKQYSIEILYPHRTIVR